MIASVGEIDLNFTRDKWSVRLRATVVDHKEFEAQVLETQLSALIPTSSSHLA